MKSAFEELTTGLDDVKAFLAGERKSFKVHVPDEVDVKSIDKSGCETFVFFHHKPSAIKIIDFQTCRARK